MRTLFIIEAPPASSIQPTQDVTPQRVDFEAELVLASMLPPIRRRWIRVNNHPSQSVRADAVGPAARRRRAGRARAALQRALGKSTLERGSG